MFLRIDSGIPRDKTANGRSGDDEAATIVIFAETPGTKSLLRIEQPRQRLAIAVRVRADIGPGEPATVEQARVILAVGEHHVPGPDQSGDRPGVGGEARGKDQGGLGPLEGSQAPLQFCVVGSSVWNR